MHSDRLVKSTFLRNVAAVSSGQFVSAAIPLLTAPLLGRLFTPGDYGPLFAYMACASQVGSIGNWQYSQGIVIVKNHRYARALLSVCIITSLITAFAATLVVLWISDASELRSGNSMSLWFWLLPLTAFLGGFSQALSALANRHGIFANIARSQIITAIVVAISSISFGSLGIGTNGLFITYFIGQSGSILLILRLLHAKNIRIFSGFNWKIIWRTMWRHRAYALYTMPATFIDTSASNAIYFSLTANGAIGSVGALGRANQLLGLPLGLIGASVATVFQRRAALDWQSQGTCRPLFKKTFGLLCALGLMPTLVITVFAPQIFSFVLGAKWIEAGWVAQILAPMFLIRVLANPLSTVFYVRGKQRLALIITGVTSGITWIVALSLIYFHSSTQFALTAFSATGCLTYAIFLFVAWRLSKPSHAI